MEPGDAPVEARNEFPLARYFLVVSLVVMGLATGLAAWFTVREVRAELLGHAAANAALIAGNLFHQIEEEYLRPLIERGETYDHANADQVEALGRVVNRSLHGYSVHRLYFFDTSGLIVFSTQREHIGLEVPPGNQQFHQAARGTVAWTVKRRNDPLDLTGNPTARELLETYVPVYSKLTPDPGAVAGVIEIYQDIEHLQDDIRVSRNRIITTALCSLGALFLVFAAFIVRADRVIRDRRRELLRSNRALAEFSRNLEELVEKRTRQLIDKQKLASLGSIAAGVAHEINTPLATIAACSEGAAGRLRGAVNGGAVAGKESRSVREIFQYLELINAEAFRCKEITRSLLDYARQTPVSELTPVDLNDLVEQALVLARLDAGKSRVRLETELESELPAVRGDAAQIQQVVHNLIANAVYAVRGTDDACVVLRTYRAGDRICFECQDNGPGVPAGDRERIFDPFFTTKPPREGTGLGLALCFSIIERHGGNLELVRSAAGAGCPDHDGTVFRFTLARDAGKSD